MVGARLPTQIACAINSSVLPFSSPLNPPPPLLSTLILFSVVFSILSPSISPSLHSSDVSPPLLAFFVSLLSVFTYPLSFTLLHFRLPFCYFPPSSSLSLFFFFTFHLSLPPHHRKHPLLLLLLLCRGGQLDQSRGCVLRAPPLSPLLAHTPTPTPLRSTTATNPKHTHTHTHKHTHNSSEGLLPLD